MTKLQSARRSDRAKIRCQACLWGLLFAAPISTYWQEVRTDPSEVLNGDELGALEALKAAGGDRFRSVGVTVDKQAGLVSLHFSRELTAGDTPLLRQISKLGNLFFTGGPPFLTDEQLHSLEDVGMTGIIMWGQPITDNGLKTLKKFPKLKQVTFHQTKVTDAGLALLCELPHLKRVDVAESEITDAGLKHLSEMTRLEHINLFHCNKITDDGIRLLSSLVNLERLFLNNNDQLPTASLEQLVSLKKIKRVL